MVDGVAPTFVAPPDVEALQSDRNRYRPLQVTRQKTGGVVTHNAVASSGPGLRYE